MMALSIRQPWCWAILHGGKDIENRDWPTKYRGRILIHAAKKYEEEDEEFIAWLAHETTGVSFPCRSEILCGGIVGSAYLARCVATHKSPWFFGPFGFELTDPQPLPFRPCRGMPGFFNVDWNEPQTGQKVHAAGRR